MKWKLAAGLAWVVSLVPAAARAGDTLAARFEAAVAARGEAYRARRAKLVGAGRKALALLDREAEEGKTAARRALAAAIAFRIRNPQTAARLDAFAPPARCGMRRNPMPGFQASIHRAYRAHPALAFERLATGTELVHWQIRGLCRAVAESKRDAAERLVCLLGLHPLAGLELARLEGPRAGPPLAGALEEAKSRDAKLLLIEALAVSHTRAGRARQAARRLLRDPPDEDIEKAAIRALGAMRDRQVAAELLRSLAVPDTTDGSGARREVTVRALQSILGPAEVERRATSLAGQDDPVLRRAAACLLGWLTREGRASARQLARLIRDPAPEVRLEALASLAWLCVQLDPKTPAPDLGDEIEHAVLQATRANEARERIAAAGALWRLVVEKMRPVSRPIRHRVVQMALSDPDERVRSVVLHNLDDYLGPQQGPAVLLMLDDLGRLPPGALLRGHRERLQQRRAAILTKPVIRELAESDLPALRAVAKAWTGRGK